LFRDVGDGLGRGAVAVVVRVVGGVVTPVGGERRGVGDDGFVGALQGAGGFQRGGEVAEFRGDRRAELTASGGTVPTGDDGEREPAADQQGADHEQSASPVGGALGEVVGGHQTVLRASVGARRAARVAG
jgi:hypothetical protein